MNKRTPMQTLLLVVGAVVLLGGLVCVVAGLLDFGSTDPTSDGDSSMPLFAAGGFAMVIGFGIIAFTRVAILQGNGGYTRVTIEQGGAPPGGAPQGRSPRGDRFCTACGEPISPAARFCESCGSAVA